MSGKDEIKLLSGGNPQIPKGYGDEVVQRYIAAMPGWKAQLGKRLDTIIESEVPDVVKAVKWNQPFYGRETDYWFVSFRCYTKFVRAAFYKGSALDPQPPKSSKHESVRYFDIFEGDEFEDQFTDWVRQAKDLPGVKI